MKVKKLELRVIKSGSVQVSSRKSNGKSHKVSARKSKGDSGRTESQLQQKQGSLFFVISIYPYWLNTPHFSWFYKKLGPFYKKLESDKIGKSSQTSKANVASNNKIQSLHMWDLVHLWRSFIWSQRYLSKNRSWKCSFLWKLRLL